MAIRRQMLKNFETHGNTANQQAHHHQMAGIGHSEQQANDSKCKKALAADITNMRSQADRGQGRKSNRQKRRPGQNSYDFSKHRAVISQAGASAALLAMQG